jgi:nucleoside-diphosphate-sugar epimerase
MGNVILIGGSGFLGSAVMQELLAKGHHVYATQNKRPVNNQPGVTVIEGGIKSLTATKLNEIKPEAIFHCARPVMPKLRQWGRVVAAWQAKRYNQFLLRQIAASHDRPVLFFASGSLVYGNSPLPHDEDAAIRPISYARQYHRGEQPILAAVGRDPSKVLLLRFPWLLGNGSWFSWFYLKSIKESKRVPLFGNGENAMSLISLPDAARIMVDHFTSGKESGVYNIFSPFVHTQRSFAEHVASHYSAEVTDFRDLYPKGVEKAVLEAFESNILLTSKHPELLKEYPFKTVDSILNGINT